MPDLKPRHPDEILHSVAYYAAIRLQHLADKLKDKHVLVTGATGLIGINLCHTLTKLGANVTGVCGKRSAYLGSMQTPGKITWVHNDLTQSFWVSPDYDYIIHAAGHSQPDLFTKDPYTSAMLNVACTGSLLRHMRGDATLLFLSTSELYQNADGPMLEHTVGRTTPEHSRATYIESKRCGEALCHAATGRGQSVKIARVCSVYGPGPRLGDTRVINDLAQKALDGHIMLRDNGAKLLSFLYIEDAVVMLMNIMCNATEVTYNVAGAAVTSVLNLAGFIATKVGIPIPEANVSSGLNTKSYSELFSEMIDPICDKYYKEFGVMAHVPFTRGVDATIEWFAALKAFGPTLAP